MNDEFLSAEEKISMALSWVASYEPVAVPAVLANWRVEPSFARSSFATNGRVLWFNPAFVDRCSPLATRAIVLHEVGHVLCNHEDRRSNRDHEVFSRAADLALNTMLWNGFVAAYNGDAAAMQAELIEGPIAGCCVGYGPYKDLPPHRSAEEYYDLLKAMTRALRQQASASPTTKSNPTTMTQPNSSPAKAFLTGLQPGQSFEDFVESTIGALDEQGLFAHSDQAATPLGQQEAPPVKGNQSKP